MPPLAVVQFAKARADVALDATVAELVPVTRREMGTFEILFHDQRSCYDGGAYTIENSGLL